MSGAHAWIERALANSGTSRWADVAGNRIHYLEWEGPARSPGILLVHGFRAHAHWWDFIAPYLAQDFRVIAMDLGGMGDSGHRAQYSHAAYAEEIAGIIAHTQLRDAVVIGHSFGGMMAISACYRFPELIRRAILVDSRVSFADNDYRVDGPAEHAKKYYADVSAALARFRLVPEQDGVIEPIFNHVALHSITENTQGWSWKFDAGCAAPNLVVAPLQEADMLARLTMPVDFIYGDRSVVVPYDFAQRVGACIRNGRGPIAIADSQHHVLLDQPLALLAALRALLAVAR